MKLLKIATLGTALMLLAAPSFAQRGGGFGGFGGRGGGSKSGLLRMPEVQKELKLDDAQIDLIKQLQAETQKKRDAAFPGGRQAIGQAFQNDREGTTRKLGEISTEEDKKAAEILDAKQNARLKQLWIQRSGNQVLVQKEVADELKLSADQRTKIQAALDGQREAGRAMFQGFDFQNATPEERQKRGEEVRKKMADLTASTDAKVKAILTPAQSKQFEGMKGAPFTFPAFGQGRGNAANGGQRRQRRQRPAA